jgi:hypothetical protein
MSSVRTQDGLSPEFIVRTGVRQGCILSPLLFNFVLDWVLARSIDDNLDGVTVGVNCAVADLDYADDIALLEPDSPSMQRLLDRLSAAADSVGLKIKPVKTKVMSIHAPAPVLQVYGEQIEVVQSFCYLGSIISAAGNGPAEDIDSRIGKASVTFRRLATRLWKRQDIVVATKMKIFNASVMSILLYGCETWCPLRANISKLEVFHMSCLRAILGVSIRERMRNVDIRKLCCNQPTVEERLKKSRLRWLGHVVRMPPERLCSQIWDLATPAEWRCVRGAPKKTWLSTVQGDLGHLKSTYGAAEWARNSLKIIRDLAQDRAQWRRLIHRGHPTAVGDDEPQD